MIIINDNVYCNCNIIVNNNDKGSFPCNVAMPISKKDYINNCILYMSVPFLTISPVPINFANQHRNSSLYSKKIEKI